MRFSYILGCIGLLIMSSAQAFVLQSSDFTSGGMIPKQFTCQGQDVSPALQWNDAPPNTEAFALIVRDPDAPDQNTIHWLIYNIPAETSSLVQNINPKVYGYLVGKNSWNKSLYQGPCPPMGNAHHYRFEIYALDQALYIAPDLTVKDLEAAMNTHILGMASLVGLYKSQ